MSGKYESYQFQNGSSNKFDKGKITFYVMLLYNLNYISQLYGDIKPSVRQNQPKLESNNQHDGQLKRVRRRHGYIHVGPGTIFIISKSKVTSIMTILTRHVLNTLISLCAAMRANNMQVLSSARLHRKIRPRS